MSIFSRFFGKPSPQLYHLFSARSAEILGPWAPQFPAYKQVIGYSSLGHVFLHAPETQDYAVLYPFKGAAKSYGPHSSVEAFEASVLKEPGFKDYVLRPPHVQAIANRIGTLKEDEIYIPEPYPFLGGSEAPETYSKGNVWVFTHIVAQMGGL